MRVVVVLVSNFIVSTTLRGQVAEGFKGFAHDEYEIATDFHSHAAESDSGQSHSTVVVNSSCDDALEKKPLMDESMKNHSKIKQSEAPDSVGERVTPKIMMGFWSSNVMIFLMTAGLAVGVYMKVYTSETDDMDKLASITMMDDMETNPIHWNMFKMCFKDRALEAKWQSVSHHEELCVGARTLLLGTGGMMVYQFIRYFAAWHVQCLSLSGSWFVFLLASLVVIGGSQVMCCKNPSDYLYWPAYLFYWIYIPANAFPPFSWSCHQLRVDCYDETYFMIREAARHVDCSLQGHTMMQMIMAWLLLQPWLLPKIEMMHLTWFWILIVYPGWTFCHRHWTAEDIFSRDDCLYRTFLLAVANCIAIVKKYYMEKEKRMKFLEDQKHQLVSKKIFHIFEDMMPEHVIGRMLLEPENAIADQVGRISIMFILIADFDSFTRSMTPRELLGFLNEQFTSFDEVCKANNVTKVETVGEEYVACVGVLPSDIEINREHGHGFLLERLFKAGGEILKLQTGKVKFKMGVHTGPIVAGVIGNKLPRFRLFGDTINSAARMMQKGLPGQLQFGVETHNDITEALKLQIKVRGEVEMKGKGKVMAYTYEPPATSGATPAAEMSVTPPDPSKSSKRGSLVSKILMNKGNKTDEGKVLLEDEEGASSGGCFVAVMKHMQELDMDGSSFANDYQEIKWFEWFHKTSICENIAQRFGIEPLLILVLSGLELGYMIKVQIWHYHHPFLARGHRWIVYVYVRGFILFIGMSWWYGSLGWKWIENNPKQAQRLMVLSSCVVSVLMFVSYDSLTFSNTPAYREDTHFADEFEAPKDQVYTLHFVIFYFLVCRIHAFTFSHSIAFAVLSVLFMSCQDIYKTMISSGEVWESMFSFAGKLLFVAQTLLNLVVAFGDEQTSRKRWKALQRNETMQIRTNYILDTLMPPLVVSELHSLGPNAPQPSHQYRHATICQSDLCGFTALSSTRTPVEIVKFMGDLFGAFDALTDKHGVYKVETIGDAYIAVVAEAPLTPTNLPMTIVLFGLDMVRAVDEWAKNLGVKVSCRVGVHHGECMGGIVGTSMQRYHLFGDLLTGMEILESTAPEGRVQVSQACKEEVERELRESTFIGTGPKYEEIVTFEPREDESLKTSKGEEHSYDSVGGRTYIVGSDQKLRRLSTTDRF